MKVLLLSGINPSKNEKFGGIFVGKRYEFLKKLCDIKLYKIGNEYGKFYNLIRKFILKRDNLENDESIKVGNIEWNNVNLKINIIMAGLKKINPKIFYRIMTSKIGKEINIDMYDIIHAHWAYPTGYIAMNLSKLYNIPYIITCHGSDIHTEPKRNTKTKQLTLYVLENASKVVFVSQNLLNEALDLGYSGKNAIVIHNGVDLDDFNLIRYDNEYKDTKLIAYIGRLEYIKGADRIAEIFKILNKKYDDIEFIISGNGSYKNQILKELRDFDIKYRYFDSLTHKELAMYYSKCDAVIVPSRQDSFCCVGLEAQACGVKVVASKVGGIPECLGEYGYFVDEGENFETRFADKVIEAINDKLNRVEMINRVKSFTWEKETKQEFEVYKQFFDNKGGYYER